MKVTISATATIPDGAPAMRVDMHSCVRDGEDIGVQEQTVLELASGTQALSVEFFNHGDRITLARPAAHDTGVTLSGTALVDNSDGDDRVMLQFASKGCAPGAGAVLAVVEPGATATAAFALKDWSDELRVFRENEGA
jgi:hypothetical protein